MKTKVKRFTQLAPLFSTLQRELGRGSALLLDRSILELHGPACARLGPRQLVLRGGEACKRWDELGRVLSFLTELELERTSTLYVLGGGALCDLGAFAAALYRRGISVVLIPTTLLAQVDAAIGGKTAVDLVHDGHLLKNPVGVFYPAHQVWLSSAWLSSLSPRERRSGLAEILKILWLHGVFLETKGLALWCEGASALPKNLDSLLVQAIKLKQAIVEKDLHDKKGLRARLNFGHSLGHAIESLGKGRLSHGEAIAWGMWAECELVKTRFAHEVFFVLEALGYAWPRFLSKVPATAWEKLLRQDKKMRAKKIDLYALSGPGKVKKVALDPAKLAKFAADLFSKSAVI